MKLHIVHDGEGNIIAAVCLDGEKTIDRPAIRVRPLVREGERSIELHVPPEHSHLDLAAVCQRLKVDFEARFPTLKSKAD